MVLGKLCCVVCILDVIPYVKEILSNSILASVERIAHTENKGTALYGYRLYNLYLLEENNKKLRIVLFAQ